MLEGGNKMNVMWVSNQATPSISYDCGIKVMFNEGWKNKLSIEVGKLSNLLFCFPSKYKKTGQIDGYGYESFFPSQSFRRCQKDLEDIIKSFNPDVIHIHGTEYSHTLATIYAAKKCKKEDNVVVSIQGLASFCAKHYYAFLDFKTIYGMTLRDAIKGNIRKQRILFEKKGDKEEEAIKSVHHVIGRTTWDYACVNIINPNVVYHYNNEMLRDRFYTSKKWSLDSCNNKQVFMSQGGYPLKGLHLAIEAINIIKNKYPNIVLRVSGKDMMNTQFWRKSSYQHFICKLIKKYKLEKNVQFLGFLVEDQIIEEYLNARVYILPSSIENSSNSLCEAQILGVPSVASYVGGTESLITQGVNGYYYQADAPYMLAYYIDQLLSNEMLSKNISNNSILIAEERHKEETIICDLMRIYKEVSSQ